MRDFLEKVVALRRERPELRHGHGRRTPGARLRASRRSRHRPSPTAGWKASSAAPARARSSGSRRSRRIRARRARLVSIRPDATDAGASSDPEHVFVPMTCVSEGAVDVYVEPIVRPRRLVVVGATPVAEALARTARRARLRRGPRRRRQRAARSRAASRGAWLDARAARVSRRRRCSEGGAGGRGRRRVAGTLRRAGARADSSRRGASYVGLVASRKRGATVKACARAEWRARRGRRFAIPRASISARAPHPKWRLSILAEIVQVQPDQARRCRATPPQQRRWRPLPPATAIDPVCHMDVDIATAKHTAEVDGTTLLLLLRALPRVVREGPARYPRRALMIDRRRHSRPLPRARLHRQRPVRHGVAAHGRAGASRCCSKARPASARPRAPRCWPTCSARASSGCSATRASMR